MEAWITQVLIQVGIYLGVILFVFLLIDFMSVKFLRTWFRVKQSRGQLVLLHIKGVVQDYFRAGRIEEGFILYKGLNKESKRLALPDGAVYRSMGVNCLLVDDVKNAVMLRNFEVVPGYDAEKHESLYIRALYKPAIMDNNTKVLLVLAVVSIIAIGFSGYLTHGWIVSSQEACVAAVNSLKEVGKQAATTTASAVTSGAI